MIAWYLGTRAVCRREFNSYFSTPLAYVFIIIFLLLSGFFTFEFGGFFRRGQADLDAFFNFHPWLYLILVPALSMRLWAEERHSGSIELLMTLPLQTSQAVIGKFLATWLFTGIALLLTLPLWLTVNYLGNPDNGIILAAYIGSWLMSAAFIGIGGCMSALTRNQVVAFILAISVTFLFVLIGMPVVLGYVHHLLPTFGVDALAGLSLVSHFQAISRGVLDVRDVIFFVAFTALWLCASGIIVNAKKAE